MKIKINKVGSNPIDSIAQDAAERVKRALGSSGDVGTPMSLDAYIEENVDENTPQPLDFNDDIDNEINDDYSGPFTGVLDTEYNQEILDIIKKYESVKVGEVLELYYQNRQSIDYTVSQIKAIMSKTSNLIKGL